MAATVTGWTRIGRLMLDASQSSPMDETAFADWLDDCLDEIEVDSLAELRLALQPRLLGWLADHLHRVPEVHLQILAVEAEIPGE